jgi:hypothetical protein
MEERAADSLVRDDGVSRDNARHLAHRYAHTLLGLIAAAAVHQRRVPSMDLQSQRGRVQRHAVRVWKLLRVAEEVAALSRIRKGHWVPHLESLSLEDEARLYRGLSIGKRRNELIQLSRGSVRIGVYYVTSLVENENLGAVCELRLGGSRDDLDITLRHCHTMRHQKLEVFVICTVLKQNMPSIYLGLQF